MIKLQITLHVTMCVMRHQHIAVPVSNKYTKKRYFVKSAYTKFRFFQKINKTD